MQLDELKRLTGKFPALSIGVIGDFALDVYWTLEDGQGEVSVETGKRALVVRSNRSSPGGAANIVANLAGLGLGKVSVFGVIGPDMFGDRLRSTLEKLGPIDLLGLFCQNEGWDTPVWVKPYIEEDEERRLDFGFYNTLDKDIRGRLLAALDAALPGLDALVVNQQLPNPLLDGDMIEAVNSLARKHPDKVYLVDCRYGIERYRGMRLKFNDESLLRESGTATEPGAPIGLDEVRAALDSRWRDYPRPILVTRGRKGSLVYEDGCLTEVPASLVTGRIDPVGAGDTMVSAFAAALAAGASTVEAADLGNRAAAVTVAKLRQTGTASLEEIEKQISAGYLVFHPDLADDPRRAVYLPGTQIEIVNPDIPRGRIHQAIFDHDGTISTLRQGWEPIMEEVMLEAILGRAYDTVPAAGFRRVEERSREFIDQTTGIETIVQMKGLVEMVREFGFVPPDEILDAWGYKAIYNVKLLEMVNARLARLGSGELEVEDYTLKGAVDLLKRLQTRGIHCYLASGTDQEDVVIEATRLGYAGAFQGQGGIFGSVGDIEKFSKKKLIEEILRDYHLEGPQLLVFGDGPVEIREVKKVGGIAVGVASDEVRRFGLNQSKRTRLIKAGADIIVGDFTQRDRLLKYLFAED